MDEDQILQSIIADPDVVDPTIDVSQLRQATETDPRLLGGVSGIEGLKYDPTRTDYIRDLYSVYSGGLPTIDVAQDTAQIPGAIDTLVDAGGGGGTDQVTGGGETTPTNTDFEQGLIDQGIGVQGAIGDPVVAPSEIPVTQQEIDAFNALAVLDSTSTADEIMQDLNNQQAMLNPTGGNIMDDVALTGGVPDTNITAPSGDVFAAGDPLAEEKIDFDTPEQQQGFLQNVLGRAGQTDEGALTELGKVPGAVVDFANQTVDVFGQKLNVGKTLLGAGINKLVGGPVSLVFDLLPSEDPADTLNRSIVDELKAEKNYGFNMQSGNLNQDPFGRNPVSLFGNYEQILLDDATSTGTTKIDLAKKEFAQDYFDKKAGKTAPQEDIESVSGGEGVLDETSSAEDIAQDFASKQAEAELSGENIVDEFKDTTPFAGPTIAEVTGGGGNQDKGPSGPGDTSDGGFGDTEGQRGGNPYGGGAGGVQSGLSSPDVGEVSSDAGFSGPPSQSGGNGGGGGKIVCTMMNESYGFGSFRNKIWLRHSKDLAPEYQKGYHKIFLPLVRLSKTNKILKKTLEHIAVHRTIDIRQESRGKVHLLGRVYRKILEPICYWVGKYAK